MNLPRWFRQMWPDDTARRVVVAEYEAIGRQKHALADIALRGGVYSVDATPVASLYDAGVREGRRQMALEIIRICNADPAQLFGFVSAKPRREEP
ncbi:MAG: hypothetical protein KGL46_14245 [Hyphomicrobiales bacterium]|nr:hypothetical protein [Hyphomicrobiales bacterium]